MLMKQFLSFMVVFLSLTMGIHAQEPKVQVTLGDPSATEFSFSLIQEDPNEDVFIMWGTESSEKVQPEGWSDLKTVTIPVKGTELTIKGRFKTLDFNDSKISSLTVSDQTTLTQLEAKNNMLSEAGPVLLGTTNIEVLYLDKNDIKRLNLSNLTKLRLFSINENPHLGSVFFSRRNAALETAEMNGCDISHFYGVPLPALQYLSMENNSIDGFATGSYYPELRGLNLSGNALITEIDVTTLPQLTNLSLGGTAVSELNLVNNTKLTTLDIRGTKITQLYLANNKAITSLNISNTAIEQIDVTGLEGLTDLDVSHTPISRLDLSANRYLRYVYASNTGIDFLDMHGAIGINNLKKLDLTNCSAFTPQSLNFTFMAMPPASGESRRVNVLLKGANAETANTELLKTDDEHYYLPDVTGDGTASMDSVAIQIQYGDLDADHFILEQMVNDNTFTNWNVVTNKVLPGFPIRVKAVLENGKTLGGVMVNGRLVKADQFVVSATATIQPVMATAYPQERVTLTVPVGQKQSYYLAVAEKDTPVYIDWGDGTPVEVSVKTISTEVTGSTKGTSVTIYGKLSELDLSSYPGIAVDNQITKIVTTPSDVLKTFALFMNSVGSVDVTGYPNLETLDVSYCNLEVLDVSNNTGLKTLRAYGNTLREIDLTHAMGLEVLDLHKNDFETLDLSANSKLTTLNLLDNDMESLDVSHMSQLKDLNIANNDLTILSVNNNPLLESLLMTQNDIPTIDLSQNKELRVLDVSFNGMESLRLDGHDKLNYLNVGGNHWDACTLNQLYASLSMFPQLEDESTPRGNTLLVLGADEEKSDNDALHAESAIATKKGWTVDHEGDGTGCSNAYISILKSENGTIRILNDAGVELKSGDFVRRGNVITIEATPAEGYELKAIYADDQQIDKTYTINGSTMFRAEFGVATGIAANSNVIVDVKVLTGAIEVKTSAPSEITIVAANGQVVAKEQVSGTSTFNLPQGVYLVQAQNKVYKVRVM